MSKYKCTYKKDHCQYNSQATAEGDEFCDEACDYLNVAEDTESMTPLGQTEFDLLNAKPSEMQLADACMWYRHDFGILGKEERERTMFEAKEWLRAFKKAGI